MKKNYRTWFVICIGLVCILTGCTNINTNTTTSTHVQVKEIGSEGEESELVESAKEDIVQGKEVTIAIAFGYEKYAKYGRYMRVKAQITNDGEDLIGEFQLVAPNNRSSVVYRKDVSIASNETKTIALDIPVMSSDSQYKIRFVDEKNKVKISKNITTNIAISSQYPYVGVLSDSIEELAFIRTANVKMFGLDEKTLADSELGLDCLDLIVINDYDTGKLTKEQYAAIKNWVMRGGTLVLGTGVTSQKTLEMFQDDFLTGRIGNVYDGILDISAKDADVLEYEGSKPIYQKVDIGFGNVQIFSKDLSVYNDKGYNTAVNETITKILDNLSHTKNTQLLEEQDGYYYSRYDIINSLNVTEKGNTPKVGRYAIILCVYVIIIGPALYLILKKIDKRNLTWILIPVVSFAFSFAIYGLGTSTRINKPYIGYLSVLELQENTTDMVLEQTYFSVTSPTNARLKFHVEGDKRINMLNNNRYSYYDPSASTSQKEALSIKYMEDKTEVVINDNSAFQSSYFQTQSISPIDGSYESDIRIKDYKMEGSFTNRLGYDLSSSVIYTNGILTIIGDIKNEETIDLAQKQTINLKANNRYYVGDIINQIAISSRSYNPESSEQKRKNFALEYYMEANFAAMASKDYLIGFLDNKSNQMIESIGYDANGVTVVMIPLSVSTQVGEEEIVYNMNQYGKVIEGNLDLNYAYIDDVLVVEYHFPVEEQISAILYSEELNRDLYLEQSFDQNFGPSIYENGDQPFIGTIEAYNYETKEYDTIFATGEYGRWEILEQYLQEGNHLRLRYQVDTMNQQYYADYSVVAPVVSAVKGGD